MSQTALKGASVFTPRGLACVDDTLNPTSTWGELGQNPQTKPTLAKATWMQLECQHGQQEIHCIQHRLLLCGNCVVYVCTCCRHTNVGTVSNLDGNWLASAPTRGFKHNAMAQNGGGTGRGVGSVGEWAGEGFGEGKEHGVGQRASTRKCPAARRCADVNNMQQTCIHTHSVTRIQEYT